MSGKYQVVKSLRVLAAAGLTFLMADARPATTSPCTSIGGSAISGLPPGADNPSPCTYGNIGQGIASAADTIELLPAGRLALTINLPVGESSAESDAVSIAAEPEVVKSVAAENTDRGIPSPLIVAFAAFVGLVVIGRRDVVETRDRTSRGTSRSRDSNRVHNPG